MDVKTSQVAEKSERLARFSTPKMRFKVVNLASEHLSTSQRSLSN
jgi:hypothetical protein